MGEMILCIQTCFAYPLLKLKQQVAVTTKVVHGKINAINIECLKHCELTNEITPMWMFSLNQTINLKLS